MSSDKTAAISCAPPSHSWIGVKSMPPDASLGKVDRRGIEFSTASLAAGAPFICDMMLDA